MVSVSHFSLIYFSWRYCRFAYWRYLLSTFFKLSFFLFFFFIRDLSHFGECVSLVLCRLSVRYSQKIVSENLFSTLSFQYLITRQYRKKNLKSWFVLTLYWWVKPRTCTYVSPWIKHRILCGLWITEAWRMLEQQRLLASLGNDSFCHASSSFTGLATGGWPRKRWDPAVKKVAVCIPGLKQRKTRCKPQRMSAKRKVS